MPRASRRSASPKAAADVRSVVITGEGSTVLAPAATCSACRPTATQPPEVQAQSIEGLHSWIEAIRTFPKPVIAAVEGAAAGAGFSLALACDLIVAADDAVFVMAYSNVALSPDGGASWSLSQALPRQLVSELLMSGERIGAARLHELGRGQSRGPTGGGAGRGPGAGRKAQRARAQCAGQHQGTHERRRRRHADRAAGQRARPLRAGTCTTPTPASASPRSWPSSRPTTSSLAVRFRRQPPLLAPVPHATMYASPVTQKTDHGRPHSYHRRTRGDQFRSLVFIPIPIPAARHSPMRLRQTLQGRRTDLPRAATRPRSGSPAPRARCA